MKGKAKKGKEGIVNKRTTPTCVFENGFQFFSTRYFKGMESVRHILKWIMENPGFILLVFIFLLLFIAQYAECTNEWWNPLGLAIHVDPGIRVIG